MKKYTRAGRDFTLKQIQPNCVQVTYRDVYGFYGVSSSATTHVAFTYVFKKSEVRPTGVLAPPKYRHPINALDGLCDELARMQITKEEEAKFNIRELETELSEMLAEMPDVN